MKAHPARRPFLVWLSFLPDMMHPFSFPHWSNYVPTRREYLVSNNLALCPSQTNARTPKTINMPTPQHMCAWPTHFGLLFSSYTHVTSVKPDVHFHNIVWKAAWSGQRASSSTAEHFPWLADMQIPHRECHTWKMSCISE